MKKYNSSGGSSSDLGFWSVLQIVFLVLKLTGLVNWSWLAVFSPTIIGLVITVIVLIILYVVNKLY